MCEHGKSLDICHDICMVMGVKELQINVVSIFKWLARFSICQQQQQQHQQKPTWTAWEWKMEKLHWITIHFHFKEFCGCWYGKPSNNATECGSEALLTR